MFLYKGHWKTDEILYLQKSKALKNEVLAKSPFLLHVYVVYVDIFILYTISW